MRTLADIHAAHQAGQLGLRPAVWALTELIPEGTVTSYGALAAALGRPRAARQVGYALAALPAGHPAPWWRVVRADGSIALQGDPARGPLQAQLLRDEGVEVVDLRARGPWFRPLP